MNDAGEELESSAAERRVLYFVSVAERCNVVAEEVADAALELKTEFGGLAATCIARAAQSVCSVKHLAQMGFNGDAMSVCRTIVELAIDVAYIATDPDCLIRKFIGYADSHHYKLAQAVDRLHNGALDRDAMRALREQRDEYKSQNPESKINWAGESLRWRAEHSFGGPEDRADCVRMYEILYADMCGAAHSGHVTLRYAMIGDESGPKIRFGPMEPEAKPVVLASISMLRLIGTVCEACKLVGFLDKLEELWGLFRKDAAAKAMAPSER
jgi:hypothetical protein